MQSLFTMCFLALLLLVYRRRTLLLTPVYLLVALVLAVFGNIIRVTTIALAEAWFSIDLAEGWQHELVGYIALAISAGVLLSFDHLITVLFHSIEAGESATSQNPLIFLWNKVFYVGSENTGGWSPSSKQTDETSPYAQYDAAFGAASKSSSRTEFPYLYRVLAGVAIACGVIMFVWKVVGTSDRRPIVSTEALLFEPTEQFLSSVGVPITVVNHQAKRDDKGDVNDRLGKHADVWRCGIGTREGDFVLTQPYVGWHELTVCYQVINWQLMSRRPVEIPGAVEPIVALEVSPTRMGYLVTCSLPESIPMVTFPERRATRQARRALAPFYPLIMDDFAEMTGSAQTLMLQYWTVSKTQMEPSEIQEIAKTMEKIRSHASQEIARQTREMLSEA